MSEIKDSGHRREFDTGAVRDMSEGKGRNDLLHPTVMLNILAWKKKNGQRSYVFNKWPIKECLFAWYENDPKYEGSHLEMAFCFVCDLLAQRDGISRLDDSENHILHGMICLSKHYENGAKKYGDNNWAKGIPSTSFYDSAHRHFDKYQLGFTDEPHLEAILFNLVGLMYNSLYMPEMQWCPYKGGRLHEKEVPT